MKKIISWISFIVVMFAVVMTAMFSGAYAANFFVDYFNLSGLWCLLAVFPMAAVGLAVEAFIILGLQKFGER